MLFFVSSHQNNSIKKSPEEDPDKPYTFADAMPDAFVPTPDVDVDADPEEDDPDYPEHGGKRKQNESKGAKRIKKALHAKQSFVIDADIFEDPSNLQNLSTSTNTRRLNRAILPKLTSKSSFYEKGEGDGGSKDSARRPPYSVFDIAGAASKDSKDGSTGKKMSPKTSFNLNDGLAKLLPKSSFTLSDGSARNADASPGIGYGNHKTLSKQNSEGSKNNSRNNSSTNLLKHVASAFGVSPGSNNTNTNNTSNYSNSSTRSRPGYSAMNSLDYIPTGFDDEDFLPSTNNSIKQSSTPTPDTSVHSPSAVQSALLKSTDTDQDASPPVSPQMMINPFRINVPLIDTSHADKRISPANTARSQASAEDTGVHTSRTNNSYITSEGVHSFDENDVLPAEPAKKTAFPAVTTHFAGKLLNKMKQKAASAAHAVHLPHVNPAAPAVRESHNMSPTSDDYQRGHHSEADDSSYDSDGKKKEKKKHKPALLELFGMKKGHSKHHHHAAEQFVLPESYSDEEGQTPHFVEVPQKLVKGGSGTNYSVAHPDKRHSRRHSIGHDPNARHGNRERTHSNVSAISGRDTPTSNPSPAPVGTPSGSGPVTSSAPPAGAGTGVSKLFGLVSKAMSPSNHAAANSKEEYAASDSDAQGENHNPAPRSHMPHDHLHKENSGSTNNNNINGNNNLMNTIGDMFKKPPRRGSAASEIANSDQISEDVDAQFGTAHGTYTFVYVVKLCSYRHFISPLCANASI